MATERESEPIRVGVYARISVDADGTQTATARQLADCRAFAQHRHWEVTDVFEDVDISAYQTKVKRPEFERRSAALTKPFSAQVLERNIVKLAEVRRPLSCYAIVTPGGLRHESFEPEQHDVVLAEQGQNEGMLPPSTAGLLSGHQVTWRNELERLFALHGDHWAVGCTVQLQFGTLQKLCTG